MTKCQQDPIYAIWGWGLGGGGGGGRATNLVKKLPKLFVLRIVQFSEKIGWGVWAQTFSFEVYPTCVFICKAGGSRM